MTRQLSIPELRTLTARPAEQTPGRVACESDVTLPHGIAEIMRARLVLLAELEASLQASQQALLSRDISSLERRTSEQLRLQKALAILSAPSRLPGRRFAGRTSALSAELRAAETRVLQHARVQAALLDRAQRWLRTVANLLAGVEKNYAPPSGTPGIAYPVRTAAPTGPKPRHPAARQGEERDACRA
jgi:hypothetical protein